jgi:hypothetical protein
MAAAEKVIAGATSGLGAKPLVVLEAGVRSEPGITNQVWTAAQQAAAKISTNSVFGIVTDSTHPIPQLNPAAVQASVDAISASVKSGQAMPSCPATFAPAGIKCQ